MQPVMDRREFLSLALYGSLPLGLAAQSLFAQEAGPQVRPLNNALAGPAQGQPAAPPNPQVIAALRMWETKSTAINRLRGTFDRYVYDKVFSVEKRSAGVFIYEAPDKGRIDFNPPAALPNPAVNPKRTNAQGQPFKVVADNEQKWVCTGDKILVIDVQLKTVRKVDIPPQYRGENISNGPLPFLFGIKADKAMQRYDLAIGQMNSAKMVHLVAKPKLQQDAREWSQAEVMLDGQTFQPAAIRLFDPGGNAETVYVFDVSKQAVNERWLLNPFSERQLGVSGFQIIEESTAEAPPEMQKPAGKSIIR
jgi:TIGR03009 family protein